MREKPKAPRPLEGKRRLKRKNGKGKVVCVRKDGRGADFPDIFRERQTSPCKKKKKNNPQAKKEHNPSEPSKKEGGNQGILAEQTTGGEKTILEC